MEFSRHPLHTSFAAHTRASRIKIIRLCGMLLLVILLMGRAGDPNNWRWMWRLGPPDGIPGEARPDTNSGLAAATAEQSATPIWLPTLDRSLLRTVEDNTVFRAQEKAAWFHLLGLLQNTSPDQLRSYSNGPVTYLQLLRQTDAYRGQVVDVAGTVRRVVKVHAADNQLGIDELWQCWLFLNEGPREPTVVYALQLPASLAVGDEIAQQVRLQGIVYKRWSFQSGEGLTAAPVLVATELQPVGAPQSETTTAEAEPSRPSSWQIVILAAAGLATAVLLMQRASRSPLTPATLRRKRERETDIKF